MFRKEKNPLNMLLPSLTATLDRVVAKFDVNIFKFIINQVKYGFINSFQCGNKMDLLVVS
jgi:hypothetical protein